MEAHFVNDPNRGCQCGEFEYRQWIRGRFLRMRKQDQQVHSVKHFLPGGKQLSPHSWELDGQGGLIYGKRHGQSNEDNDEYPLDRLHGCRYRGHDNPLIVIDANDKLVGLDLEFRGEVVHIDASTGQVTPLISKTWDVADTYVVSPEAGGMPPEETPFPPQRTGVRKGAIGHGNDDPEP
jgi:hypothetical protein